MYTSYTWHHNVVLNVFVSLNLGPKWQFRVISGTLTWDNDDLINGNLGDKVV